MRGLTPVVSMSLVLSFLSPECCARVFFTSTVLLRVAGQLLLCPHPPVGDQALLKLCQTQPGGSIGWPVPPKTGVCLGSQRPVSTVTALDNVFQVFHLRTKKLFSGA